MFKKQMEKMKEAVKKYAPELIFVGGAMVLGGCVTYAWTGHVYKQGFMAGGKAAIPIAFGVTVDWCDKEFPETHLASLVEAWAKDHPEEWITV